MPLKKICFFEISKNKFIILILFYFYCFKIKHNLQWEASLREIGSLSPETAFQVREITGPDLKSCIRHIVSLDSRDIPVFSTCGDVVRLTTELAGIGGDVGFIKNEIKIEEYISLYKDIV